MNRVALVLLAVAAPASADRDLSDYRYFRSLSIDLQGRPPTRGEIAQLEGPRFDFGTWIDAHLDGPRYAERLRRVYTDLLRLELAEGAVAFRPPSALLRWTQIMGPDGRMIDLYFREGQRRTKNELDGWSCFSPAETGLRVLLDGPPVGHAKPVSKTLLDARTVVVKPWWLYADYRARDPRDRANESWLVRFGYELLWSMFVEPDGKTPMTDIRVCREEAQTADSGRVYVTGRVVGKGELLPGRVTKLPVDSAFAKASVGKRVSCSIHAGFESSTECGCGVGLERCLPTGPNGFVMPWSTPLGIEYAFDSAPRPALLWLRAWWSQEAERFLDAIFDDDRDVREILTARWTVVNGPLAQFYRFLANASYYGDGVELGYTQPEPLFDPAAVPRDLMPYQVNRWQPVGDRGKHAAGVMTMPIFLLKYGTRRQRAHAIYNTFLCREFVAESVALPPSDIRDLTKRPGCSACHVKLEPMSAYFTRIRESDWTYLPPAVFPTRNGTCKGAPAGSCRTFYDPDTATSTDTFLRGAYSAPAHADAGPAGFAAEITSSPEFASCVVKNLAQSLLGRTLTPADEAWKVSLAKQFVAGGYKARALVRAILVSPQYRDASDHVGGAR